MTRLFYLMLATLPGLVHAGDTQDLIEVISRACITPLEQQSVLAPNLERAPQAMEVKLLNGKDGRLFSHSNPKIVVVAHTSGETCEVMGLGLDVAEVSAGITQWAAQADYTVAPDAKMSTDKPGGAYLARAVESGFVQVFVHTDGPRGFAGITASRVADSTQAREVLGQ